MAPGAAAQFDTAALQARQALQGKAGPMALVTNAKVFGIACFACLGGLLYGYNQGVFSGVLAMNNFNAHMGVWTKDQTNKGWLTSILELGAWVGTIYSGFLAEIFSRKYAILMNTVVFIIGVVIQATAVTSAGHSSILAGRFITGMGVGSLSMIVPMYNAECAPPEVRGALVGLQQLAITTGIMFSFWIDYGTNYIGGTGDTQVEAAWLVPLCLQLAPALLLGGGILFMPFSPRWLEHHGREAEARKTLASLRGLSQDHELIELEYAEIKAQSLFEKRTVAEHFPKLADGSASSTIKLQFVAVASLFKSKPMLRRVGLATVTMFFQQWTGINAILYYAPQIFQGLGLGGNTISLLATGVVGIVMWLATFPAVMYVDKIGRKPILVSGAIGMGVCHLIVAGIMATYQHDWPAHVGAGWVAVVMVWIFVIFFGYSWGPCAWIIIAEIWPISQRPYGIALGASSNWMNNFIVGQVTPDMFTGITYGTFILFGLLIMMGGAFIWFFFPETKGLSLEEMDVLFGSVGVAAADAERMREINREVGLDNAVRHGSIAAGLEKGGLDEKADRMDSE
ncbi:hypothetical protein LTR91_003805 [Friedmanniomyces endolithicus]|uniref:Major facilitator superfamily (MFS) profile domain-containing protein n=1 Tax=Friedmanniomyces endolithicus TaxID=329885 RepID=A0A4U0V547_9PEZI|nr:hypothetical protein LTS09_003215 [Friedmanniomyces endolithicus]KAK0275536.1 hypothetical protein LTS00_014971 [Friedmanniomyces endolithicus]KAK0281580.1 hypothetical protein LTR35_007259 [Friedmanniomyces endolithicus]KAK0308653.1 hypothetical protein LTR82_015465 [Friedmanniomyces endolithicus]KAK0315433.1 hypothetical protein LTR01_000731 [Friedmanniomyces endolithicus]